MAGASRLWCRLRTSQYFCLCVCCANLKQTDVCVHCAALHRPPPGWITPFFTLSFLFVFSLCANKNQTMRPGGVGIVVVVVGGGFVFHRVCQVAPRPEATAELKTKITTSSCSEPPASVSPQRGFRFPPIYERRRIWFWLSRLSKLFPSWQPLGKFTTQGIRLLP